MLFRETSSSPPLSRVRRRRRREGRRRRLHHHRRFVFFFVGCCSPYFRSVERRTFIIASALWCCPLPWKNTIGVGLFFFERQKNTFATLNQFSFLNPKRRREKIKTHFKSMRSKKKNLKSNRIKKEGEKPEKKKKETPPPPPPPPPRFVRIDCACECEG